MAPALRSTTQLAALRRLGAVDAATCMARWLLTADQRRRRRLRVMRRIRGWMSGARTVVELVVPVMPSGGADRGVSSSISEIF